MMSACSMRLRPLMVATALALLAPALARAQGVVQTFFIPFDEEEVHLVLNLSLIHISEPTRPY